MKRTLTALIAFSALIGTVAFADSGRRDQQHWQRDGRARQDHRDFRHRDYDRHDYRRRDFDRHDYRPPNRRDYRHYDRHPRFHIDRYHRPHGYVPRSWRRGDRLPVSYHATRYVVRDYRAYQLHAPPRGYHWVRVDNDVILAGIAGGLVAEVVTGWFS